MRGRLLHTINSLALSVTCGDRFPLLSLRDIFPRPGEVFPQRERPWQRDEVCVDCQGLPLWGDAELAKIEASVTKFAKFSEIQKRMFQALFLLEENFAATAKAVPLGKVA